MNRLYVGTLFQAVPECFFKILGEITCKELFRLSVSVYSLLAIEKESEASL
jgi:hypothetical protein